MVSCTVHFAILSVLIFFGVFLWKIKSIKLGLLSFLKFDILDIGTSVNQVIHAKSCFIQIFKMNTSMINLIIY